MTALLFLCHRLPFPPDKGDKIRAFHLLKALTARYRVYVGTFVDSDEDWQHVESLRPLVHELYVRPLGKRKATLRSLRGLLTGSALTIPYYGDSAMQRWVDQLLAREQVDRALVYSSGMGQYLAEAAVRLKIMDFCDLDSDKWAQYAQSKSWPSRLIYAREARKLGRAERELAECYTHSLFVSDNESALFRSLHPQLAHKVATLGNGVDTDYFDPDAPIPVDARSDCQIVFTGAMDYWANVDAVTWFAQQIWPLLRQRHPELRFAIVGSRPSPEVQRLAGLPGIIVTGRVPDVRPWLQAAGVVVAPLRIARGVQNKVLEAMAMARTIVATPAALQGLGGLALPDVHCAESPAAFADAVAAALSSTAARAIGNRQFVLQHYSWSAALAPLWQLLESPA